MKLPHTLITFIFTLQGGNTGRTAGQHRTFTGNEGGNITVECTFTFSGGRKLFCKQGCEEGILVQMTGDQAENGRYSIKYSKSSFLSNAVLYVNVTQLTRSDSGRYMCGLERSLLPDSHQEFEIIVTDAPTTSKPNWTHRPFSTSVPSASTPPPTGAQSSGSFTSSPASPETTTQSGQQWTERTAAHSRKLLVVLILVVNIVLLSLAVLFIFCGRRAIKSRGCRDLSELTYSEVGFPHSAAPPHGDADVVYSEVCLSASPGGNHNEDASPPLYSVITFPQQ